MTDEPFETSEDVHRDRREHGGASSSHPDDDDLARRTEQQRVEVGVDDFDPDDVPPATDDPVPTDLTETDQYQDAEAEIRREAAEGELYPLTERHPFPPTNYDRD